MNNITALELLTFVISLITIIGALAKAFTAINSLDRRIEENNHSIELLREKAIAGADKLELGINGAKEMVQHIRTRTQGDYKDLNLRLTSLENFLAKTTDFEKRE